MREKRTLLAIAAAVLFIMMAAPAHAQIWFDGNIYMKMLWGTDRLGTAIYNYTAIPGEGLGDSGQGTQLELFLNGKVGKKVRFSELFGDKSTLLLYSWMYGPNWDHPCPSCTSLMDGFDRTWYSVSKDAAFLAIAKASADQINAWAKHRGWSQIALVSGSDSPFQADYKCQGGPMICNGR